MLIPRFTVRWLMTLITVCAVFSLIVRFAGLGQHWAVGIVTAVGVLAVAMGIYGFIFCVAYLLFQLGRSIRPRSETTSPFATDNLPPQVIPSRTEDR